MATDSSILAWRIPWTEEPGRLQSIGSQRVRHGLATKQQQQQRKPNEWERVKQPLCAQQCARPLGTCSAAQISPLLWNRQNGGDS